MIARLSPLLCRFVALFAAVSCALALGRAEAQPLEAVDKATRLYEQLRLELDAVRADIAQPAIAAAQLAQRRGAADNIRLQALAAEAETRRPLRELSQRLKGLGDPPGVGGEEAPAVAAERKRLGEAVAALQGVGRQLGVLALEAEQVSAEAAIRQRDLFIRQVFEPSRSALNPALWREVVASLPILIQRNATLFSAALAPDPTSARLVSPLTALLLSIGAAVATILIAWRLSLKLIRRAPAMKPDALQRLWRVTWVFLFTVGLLIFGFSVGHVVADATGGIAPRLLRVLRASEQAALYVAAMLALAWTILAPHAPAWRLVDLDDRVSRKLAWTITAIALLFTAERVVSTLADVLFLPLEFTVGWSSVTTAALVVLIALVLIITRRGAGASAAVAEAGRRYYFGWTVYFYHIVWIVILAAAASLVLGYVALGQFLATKIVGTASVVSILYLLHHLADAAVAASLDTRTALGQFIHRTLLLGETGARRLGLVFSTVVDLGLVVLGIVLILGHWTFVWIDVTAWLHTVLFGFTIGDITVEPASILLALAIMVAGLVAARLLTTWLDRRVLARTRMDSGVRNSVRTATGYAAVLTGFVVAVSAAGVDFSSIAIIAGALSVGIGFGLQSIVNNFVSGLILLAERPIKVGDWISVTGGEGTVRRINVRSTEIDTFDRGTVIVPNSSLISNPVLNWTHADSVGRVRVAVGVSYDADPHQVEKILLACARANGRVLTFPEPFVLFMNFGQSSLDFEVRVFIPDVMYVAIVGSELRFAIFKALNEAGISIPYPQQDVHVKTLPAAAALSRKPARRGPKA
jgi:small-conductance mechanosensitive channel